MLHTDNVRVYDLKESVIACRNAMRITPPEYTQEEFEKSLPRAIQLANTTNGSGHEVNRWVGNFEPNVELKAFIKNG